MESSRITTIHGEEMREQVIDIVIDALRWQGYPAMMRDSVCANPGHRAAFLTMLVL